jgi:hypothetical protein
MGTLVVLTLIVLWFYNRDMFTLVLVISVLYAFLGEHKD